MCTIHRRIISSEMFGCNICSKWIYRILFFWLWQHIFVLIGTSVFFYVSLRRNLYYATELDYPFIANNEIINILVPKTVPNITQIADQPKCDYNQIVSDNEFVFEEPNLNELHDPSNIRRGGEFIPFDCKPEFSTAIIIPYRKRKEQLNAFLIYIHNFLRRQKIHYRIFVAEQADDKPFNRAKLFNVGAEYAIEAGFPCLVFHDVDMFPMNLGNLYACTKQPRHMTVNVDKYRFHLLYVKYFGGVVSIQSETFKKLNGMSNVYFGWGGEDDDFLKRVKWRKLDMIRFGLDYSQYSMIKHRQEIKNVNRYKLLRGANKRIETDGLNSLKFKQKQLKLMKFYTLISAEL